MRPPSGRFFPPILLLAAVFAASCGAGLENDIRRWLGEELGITADTVVCPSIFGRILRDYSCRGVAEGGEVRIRVARGGGPSGRYRVESGLVDVEEVESAIQQDMLHRTGEIATVACGKRYRVSVPGNGFSCVIHDPRGKTHLAEVTIQDSQGTVRTRIE